jgi:ppGpp synthetase/RelA/SpoT-type nucleotidyltranferase
MLNPESDDIRQFVTDYAKVRHRYDSFAKSVAQTIETALRTRDLKVNSVTSRAKGLENLRIKLTRDQYSELDYLQLQEEITDLAGVRVITFFPRDVDDVAKIVEETFEVDKENSVDKRMSADPDRFGYASVHYVVSLDPRRQSMEYAQFQNLKCEIQIRTILQHSWAEIEHDLGYKTTIVIPSTIRRRFSALSALLEVADREFQTIREEEESLRKSVQHDVKSKRLDIPIDIVSLTEYLRDKELFGAKLPGIPEDALSSLIEDMHELGINDLQTLDNLLQGYQDDVPSVLSKLKARSKIRGSLHAAGVLRIVLALSDTTGYAHVMRRKAAASRYEKVLTETLIAIVSEMHHGTNEKPGKA